MLLDGLNDAQIEAVTKTMNQSSLVIAGPGSGKTSVLTKRVAYLIKKDVSPSNILTITFTNKAANEMKERIGTIIGEDKANDVWMGTFHSICVKILRKYGSEIGISNRFTIIDSDEQKKIMKSIIAKIASSKDTKEAKMLSRVSTQKNKLITPYQYYSTSTDYDKTLVSTCYTEYQAYLDKIKCLDFDDLIMKTCHLLSTCPKVRTYYQNKFKYILLDETQDSNHAQYQLVRLLSGKTSNIFAVTDDAQCWVDTGLITTPSGPVTVKDINIGDDVLSMVKGEPKYAKVTAKSEAMIKDILSIKTSSGKVLKITSEHRCFATLPKFGDGFIYLYLMYRADKGFRLGILTGGINGTIASRANPEQPDRLWLLSQYGNKDEATFDEEYLSLRYQIPTTPYMHNGRGLSMSQSSLDKLFKEFGNNGWELLKDKDYSFDYPHYVPQGTTRFNTSRSNVNLYLNVLKHGTVVSYEKEGEMVRKYFGNDSGYLDARKFAEQLALEKDASAIVERYSRQNPIKKRDYLYVLPANQLLKTMWIPVIDQGQEVLEEIVEISYETLEPTYHIEVARTGILIVDDVVSHNCIYSWRGADIQNLHDFIKEYNPKIIKLEQNYRSTKMIVHAGNAIIKNNIKQLDKTIFSQRKIGNPIRLYEAKTGEDEASFVAREISNLVRNKGYSYDDIMILYRTNYQSRAFEDKFMNFQIPYDMSGNFSFYSRKEIKDTVAWLKVIVNQNDDLAMERILSTKPGIGVTSIKNIIDQAEQFNLSVYESAKNFTCKQSKAQASLEAVIDTLDKLSFIYATSQQYLQITTPVTDMIDLIWTRTNYYHVLSIENTPESLDQKANLDEFLTIAKSYELLSDSPDLTEFLENIALASDKNQSKKPSSVKMMSIHSSKGMESSVVFLVGMEEGLFPHANLSGHEALEEERRLCYVGITRAKNELYLSYANTRRSFSGTNNNSPSRFIAEIPEELILKL